MRAACNLGRQCGFRNWSALQTVFHHWRGGMIRAANPIYVNGNQAGEAHVAQMPAVFEVKPFLHPCENTVTVGVANNGRLDGTGGGVTFICWVAECSWKRQMCPDLEAQM